MNDKIDMKVIYFFLFMSIISLEEVRNSIGMFMDNSIFAIVNIFYFNTEQLKFIFLLVLNY